MFGTDALLLRAIQLMLPNYMRVFPKNFDLRINLAVLLQRTIFLFSE